MSRRDDSPAHLQSAGLSDEDGREGKGSEALVGRLRRSVVRGDLVPYQMLVRMHGTDNERPSNGPLDLGSCNPSSAKEAGFVYC